MGESDASTSNLHLLLIKQGFHLMIVQLHVHQEHTCCGASKAARSPRSMPQVLCIPSAVAAAAAAASELVILRKVAREMRCTLDFMQHRCTYIHTLTP